MSKDKGSSLSLEELAERMEATRETFRTDPSDDNKTAYKNAVHEFDVARTDAVTAQELQAVAASDGDAVITPDTLAASAEATA